MRNHLLFVFFLLIPLLGPAQGSYPVLTEIVTDRAGIYSIAELEELREKLTEFERETGHQLAVLAVETLQGQSIEAYALGVFNQNGLGQAGRDNGILILFSKADREVRIEVGYGLEPLITDAVASRIIRKEMLPHFREGEFFEGMDLATDRIVELLRDPVALEEFMGAIAEEENIPWWAYPIMALMLTAFLGVGSVVFLQGYIRLLEVFRGVVIGKLGVVPALPLVLVSGFVTLFGSIFIIVPLIFVAVLSGRESYLFLLGERPRWIFYFLGGFILITLFLAYVRSLHKGDRELRLSWLKSDPTYMAKTFSSTGTHSLGSGSSSSGSGSSGFSGGGGSSGGGGASGGW